MRKRFLLITCIILFISCDPMDNKMTVKNNSSESIHVRIFIKKEGDIEETMIGIRKILPNESKRLGMINSWDSEFSSVCSDTLLFVVYKDHLFFQEKEELNSGIKSDSLLSIGEYEYKEFTYNDLKSLNWLIEYSENNFLKGSKLFSKDFLEVKP